ncbi:MAG: glycoside hydrolase family 43 protein, partial [Ruminiclostridium sp.]
FDLSVDLTVDRGEAGVTVYMCESEHYEIAVSKTENGFEAVLKLNIGGIKHKQAAVPLSSGSARLRITGDNLLYKFFADDTGLGCGQTKYLSSEVSGGFTGVVIGLYAVGDNTAEFESFGIEYKGE